MLRIENLTKRFGDHVVFQGLTQSFAPGCYALSEEDNTGKSTLLKVIAGITAPDSGDIWIDGHSMTKAPRKAKARLAFVPDDCMGFPELTGYELLLRMAQEKKSALNETVMDFAYELGLGPHLDKRFEQMSTGTRRKVYLAGAAIGDPAVIIADGPTAGLDATARAVLAEQFGAWSRNRVVLFASYDTELIDACKARELRVTTL